MSKKEKEKCECENCASEEKEEKCTCEECEKESTKEEKNEYLEMAQRLQADFDNYRKRSSELLKNARIDGMVDAVSKIFPAIDAIEKSKNMITDEKVLEGVNMIEKELRKSLSSLGIEEIEVLGKPLDPNTSNVVAVISDNSLEDGVIAQVFQAGYRLKERVLRYAQVVVNRKN